MNSFISDNKTIHNFESSPSYNLIFKYVAKDYRRECFFSELKSKRHVYINRPIRKPNYSLFNKVSCRDRQPLSIK